MPGNVKVSIKANYDTWLDFLEKAVVSDVKALGKLAGERLSNALQIAKIAPTLEALELLGQELVKQLEAATPIGGTGVASSSWSYKIIGAGRKPHLVIENKAPHIAHIEFGTKPHLIPRKRAKTLLFWGTHAWQGQLISWRKWVAHPGTKPKGFIRKILSTVGRTAPNLEKLVEVRLGTRGKVVILRP